METPFKYQNFVTDAPLTTDDLDQVQTNLQYLFDNTPRGRLYKEGSGKSESEFLMVVCGREWIEKSKTEDTVVRKIKIGGGFSSKCRPNITTGVGSGGKYQVFCQVNGPGGTLLPDSNSFEIKVYVRPVKNEEWKIPKGFWVTWQAWGWREPKI